MSVMPAPRCPRIRAAVKWAGLSLCILLVAAWLGSRWFNVAAMHRRGRFVRAVGVSSGRLAVFWADTFQAPDSVADSVGPEGVSVRATRTAPRFVRWNWRPEWSSYSDPFLSGGALDLPLYIPFLLLAAPTAWLFHRDRRSARWAREGRCTGCGYDTAGLAAGALCPECGKEGSA